MDLISPIAMLAMVQAAAAPADALSASSPWRLDTIESGCELSQDFGRASGALFVIRRQPAQGTSTVRIDWAALPGAAGSATLRNERSGEEYRAAAASGFADPPTRRFLQMFAVDNAFLAKLAPNATVSFNVEGQLAAKLALANFNAALRALDQCEDTLLREWGVDPAPLAALKTRPEPTSSPALWVTMDDYSPSALNVRNPRDVVLRYRVTGEGKVEDCAVAETSGSSVLDNTACRLVTRRARYRPAVAADGSVSEAWVVQAIRWSRM
jgi:TonB family protein